MNFIVLETEPIVNNYKLIPIILDWPFLVTANDLINSRNGLMNLLFGNMILELNVLTCIGNLMKKMRMNMRLMNKENCLNFV